jgi:hypothetical protein
MTVEGVPRPLARPGAGSAVPLTRRPVAGAAPVASIAPPWQRVPGARPRGVVALVARDGRPVEQPAAPPAPTPGVHRPPVLRARPPIVEEPEILGLSRLARGRFGSRLFTLFFVAVFALIAVQTLVEILHG